MTKAILVIDMPNTCKECPLKVSDKLPTSCVFRKWHSLSVNDTYRTNSWCPLKPVPEKSCYSPFQSDVGIVKLNNAFIDGYNACIDEILGDTHE